MTVPNAKEDMEPSLNAQRIKAVLFAAASVLLFFVAFGLDTLFPQNNEIKSALTFSATVAGMVAGVLAVLRLTKLDFGLCFRATTAIAFAVICFKVGLRFQHLCSGGSHLIEGSLVVGSPLLVGAIVFLSRSRAIGFILAVLILIALWLLAGPYSTWAHR